MKKVLQITALVLAMANCLPSIAQQKNLFKKQDASKIALVKHGPKLEFFTSIQDAFNKVNDFDTVYIRKGTYLLDTSLYLWEKNNVCVFGEDKCKLICNNTYENVMWVVTCENILIKNLHCTHIQPQPEESCVGNVFALDIGRNITIEECDINGCGAIGVYIWGTEKIHLIKNIIHDNSLWAVQIDGDGMLREENTDRISFLGNKMYKNGEGRKTYDSPE